MKTLSEKQFDDLADKLLEASDALNALLTFFDDAEAGDERYPAEIDAASEALGKIRTIMGFHGIQS